jgi:hypothetical protein
MLQGDGEGDGDAVSRLVHYAVKRVVSQGLDGAAYA